MLAEFASAGEESGNSADLGDGDANCEGNRDEASGSDGSDEDPEGLGLHEAELLDDPGLAAEPVHRDGVPEDLGAPHGNADDRSAASAGASSGSAGPPPVPAEGPPADGPAVAPARPRIMLDNALGIRGFAEVVWYTGMGKISYYGTRRQLQVDCGNPAHGRCVLSRTFAAGPRVRTSPLPLCVAWLQKSFEHGTKTQHWAAENWPNEADVDAARELLASSDDAAAKALLEEEHIRFPG